MGVCLIKANTLNIYLNPRLDVRVLSIAKPDRPVKKPDQSLELQVQNGSEIDVPDGRLSRPVRSVPFETGCLIDTYA